MMLLRVTSWVRALDEVEPGDDREMIAAPPVMVLCEDQLGDDRLHVLKIVSGHLNHDANPSYVRKSDGDEFDIIPHGEWSDDACTAAAQLALIGKVLGGDS